VSELPVEAAPAVAEAAHETAGGKVVYITEGGQRLAAIVPADYAADLAEDLADAEAAVATGGEISTSLAAGQLVRELGPRRGAEFPEHLAQVVVHGAGTDEQLLGDLGVG
jgi:hypothetical protein